MLCQEKPKIRDHLVSGFFAVNPPLTRKANELSSLIYDLVFSMGNNWLKLFLRQVLVNASSKGKIKNENSAASTKWIILEL